MKSRKLKIIITLMTLAVFALLSVQMFWITKSVEIEKERFSKNVNEALLNIAKKLVKKETATVIVQKFSDKNEVLLERCDTITGPNGVYLIGDNKDPLLHSRNPKKKAKLFKVKPPKTADSLEHVLFVEESGIMGDDIFVNVEVDSFTTKRTTIVNDVIEELLIRSKTKPVTERINEKTLPQIVKGELSSRGINTDFNYAVYDQKSDSVYFSNPGININDIKSTEYRAKLFPDEVFNSPSYLLLTFPDQEMYFLKSIQTLLLVSLSLFLFIVGIFYQTAHTLIKQKKISDIKNDLINNITHEFKTPLSTISLTCEALKEPAILDNKDTVARYRDIIASEKDRLQKMVETLLKTAMFERDKLKLTQEKVNMNHFLRQEVSKYNLSLERLNGKVTFDLNADSDLLEIDKFHLGNVVSNIIDNAIKYCTNDPRILLESKSKNNSYIFSVKDNGIGINRKNIDKVFDTFYRIPTGNIQNVKGFGIGLSYAKKVVEAHGGNISIESQEDVGTNVTVILPFKGNNHA